MRRFALPPCDEELKEPSILSTTYIGQWDVEPAGERYELYLCKRLGLLDDEDDEAQEKDEDDSGDEEIDKAKLNEKRKKANKQDIMKKLVFKNHYHALGLEDKYFESTIDDVRKAYKRKVLSHHPDKFEDGAYDEAAKQQWIAIQEAYETLLDPEKKRRYDSTMEFDDSMPEANRDYSEEEFFAEFGPCIKRNATFSEKKPCPNLGDAKTAIGKVLAFYTFWESFKSWRDFTVEDEYDLEEAENRYERRYMEKENKKMKKDLLKKEKARIKKLVELCRSKDPRVIKYEKEEKERIEKIREQKRKEKEQKKEEEERRKREAQEKVEAKKRQEAEEKQRKIDELNAIKAEKKQKKDAIKASVLEKVNLPEYGDFFLDTFLDGTNEEEKNKALTLFDGCDDIEKNRASFKQFVAAVKERQTPKKKVPNSAPRDNKANLLKKWSDEELALLTKGFMKFPAGMGGRWEKITDFIGGTKTIHEVTAMAKELSIKNVRGEKNIKEAVEQSLKPSEPTMKKTTSSASEWSQEQQKALEAAMKTFPASMDKKERWTKIAEKVEGKNAKECVERVKEIKEKMAAAKKAAAS